MTMNRIYPCVHYERTRSLPQHDCEVSEDQNLSSSTTTGACVSCAVYPTMLLLRPLRRTANEKMRASGGDESVLTVL